ncbi:MAG: hypothetical protein Q8S44_03350 [Flavobacteriaceae bacterium]|nr:hypothetical protein [Flavobacteriaceae bacterium]
MWFYKFISYLFHPVFIPFFGTCLYFLIFPLNIDSYQVQIILTYIFLGTVVVPTLFLRLLKHFKLIESFQIPSVNERKLPILFFLLISFLATKILSSYRILPDLTIMFIGITFISLIAYFFISLKFKISLHAISIGGVIGVILALSKLYRMNLIFLISILFLIAGIIISSRLKLRVHSNLEVYLGFVLGITIQYGIFYYYSI